MDIIWYNKKNNSKVEIEASVKDGFIYTDNYSEELDSATIVLMYQPKRNFEPFDMIQLGNPLSGITMLIDDFVENKLDLDNDNSYQYTINLMSLTKELERITLPNISITAPKDGTPNNALTVSEAINNLLQDYSPKFINSSGQFIRLYTSGIYSSTKCPDMQMTKPTLRDAIDRILSVDNSICKLILTGNERQINAINLNRRYNEIPLTEVVDGEMVQIPYYNYLPENQSANDYASESENNYNNVVPNNISGIKNDSIVSEYIGFRTEQMILTDENGILITQNPIYDLKEVLFCGTIQFLTFLGYTCSVEYNYNNQHYTTQIPTTNSYYFELDIKPLILEEQDYNIQTYETRKSRAYFSRGDNKIQGLLKFKKQFLLEDYITLDLMIVEALKLNPRILLNIDALVSEIKNTTGDQSLDINNLINFQFLYGSTASGDHLTINFNDGYTKSSMFKIVYEAQNENIRIRSSKYLPETNQNNIIIDNPSEVYVDIKRQGELFNQKCNRLGNRVKYLQARFPLAVSTMIPNLGNYLDDYVLIHRELQYYDNYVLFKGVLTENYVNINYFTGINARKRTWNIVSAGEAFDKQLLDKWFCEFSFNNKQKYTVDNLIFSSNLSTNLLNVFNYNATYINHLLLSNGYTGISGNWNYIELDMSSYISGNSIIINATTTDNYSAGINIDDLNNTGGPSESYCKYVDNNGFANNFEIRLMTNEFITGYGYYDFYNLTNGSQVIPGQDSGNRYDALKATSTAKPKALITTESYENVMTETCIYAVNFINHKDSREKIGFNIQFEFCSDTPNIILGEAFMERQKLVNINDRNDQILIHAWWGTYKVTDKTLKGSDAVIGSIANLTVESVDGLTSRLHINLPSGTGYYSLAITDLNNKLIMAINTQELQDDHNFYIYLNMLKTRDRNKYLDSSLKSWGN